MQLPPVPHVVPLAALLATHVPEALHVSGSVHSVLSAFPQALPNGELPQVGALPEQVPLRQSPAVSAQSLWGSIVESSTTAQTPFGWPVKAAAQAEQVPLHA